MEKKKVKKKINLKGLLVIILTLYLLVMLVYYVLTLPIKNIVIKGNTLTSESEIINAASIENYPTLFKTSTSKMKKNIINLDFISGVKIKKSITGKITINVTEEKVLFYNSVNKTYVLSNEEEVKDKTKVIGLPILINYVPNEIYKEFIGRLKTIDDSVIKTISEIEYSPDISKNITIDEFRFLLRMNDGNFIYINLANIEKLNKYKEIYSAIKDLGKGILYLDSSSTNYLFKTFASIKEGEKVELPK
ncbi:MAG: FtsQ-type POTRA domain-containing protein [Bacilli bacterium]